MSYQAPTHQRLDWAGQWLETYVKSTYHAIIIERMAQAATDAIGDVTELEQENRHLKFMLALCVNKLGNRVVICERDAKRAHGCELEMEQERERKRVILTLKKGE